MFILIWRSSSLCTWMKRAIKAKSDNKLKLTKNYNIKDRCSSNPYKWSTGKQKKCTKVTSDSFTDGRTFCGSLRRSQGNKCVSDIYCGERAESRPLHQLHSIAFPVWLVPDSFPGLFIQCEQDAASEKACWNPQRCHEVRERNPCRELTVQSSVSLTFYC